MIAGVLTNDERHANMAKAIKLFPMLKKRTDFSDRWLSIACYGPSLEQTWKNLKHPIMTVSGAHDFLVERGVAPDWHVDCDPREHKAKMLTKPSNVKYLMASCCHPAFWDTLKGRDVKLWHLINGDDYVTPIWVHENHPEGIDSMIGGGSTVGQRAMNVAAALGFRRFNVYGMDCSFDGKRHAGAHTGQPQPEIWARHGRQSFRTTPQLLQSALEMKKFMMTMDVDVVFHGEGLMQTMAGFLKQEAA